MEIDPATRRNLELARTLSRRAEGRCSIVSTLRLRAGRGFCNWLAAPLTDIGSISSCLDAVEWFGNGDRHARIYGIDQIAGFEAGVNRRILTGADRPCAIATASP